MRKLGRNQIQRAERQERIVTLVNEGLDDETISTMMGISKSTVSRLRRNANIKRRPHGSVLTREDIARIRTLSESEGWPPGEIAREMGVHYTVIHQHLGASESGREWNSVARWASKNHPALWREIKPL